MRRKPDLTIRVPSTELSFGRETGVSKKQALNAFAQGYMQGVNKKAKTTYSEINQVAFRSGSEKVIKKVRR